jgi:hypothetical protein
MGLCCSLDMVNEHSNKHIEEMKKQEERKEE